MSAIIGMNLGHYVLLAADTRVTYYPGGTDVPAWHDDEEKVQKTNIGIITGMGFAPLLDSVKNRLASEDVDHTDHIVDIIREERAKADDVWSEELRAREAIEQSTSWMFTYLARHPDSGVPTVRLMLCRPQDDYRLRVCEPNTGILGPPEGLTVAEEQGFNRVLGEHFRPMVRPDEFHENVRHNAALAARILKGISEISDSVSACFQVGLHLPPFNCAVSETSCDGSFSISIAG